MRELRPALAIAALLHVLAAILTPGFFHPDEHYQTIEWANALLGRTDFASLTWEHGAQARPWLQPMLYAALASITPGGPHTEALIFRLFSSAVGVAGIAALASCIPKWFENELERKTALIGLCTFYFLPIFHARTSSENLAGSAMMIAVWLITTERGFAAGLALGAAFFFRYQSGFMILGAIIYFPKKKLFLGFVIAVLTGLILDRIGYGEWVLAPLNYFRVNLVEGKASEFGEAASWKYIGWIWYEILKPFGGLAILAIVVVAVRKPKHLLTAITVPFVLVHVVIAHKEARFLYPVLDFAPISVVLAVSPYLGAWKSKARTALLTSLFALNGWALVTMGFHPPLIAGAWIKEADPKLPLVYLGRPPYGQDLQPTFYNLPRASKIPVHGPHLLHHDGMAPVDPQEVAGCKLIVREPPIARILPVDNKSVRSIFGVRQILDLYFCP